MLEIEDLSDKDALFYFKDGLGLTYNLRIGREWSLIGVMSRPLMQPLLLLSLLSTTPPRIKSPTLERVGERKVDKRKTMIARIVVTRNPER